MKQSVVIATASGRSHWVNDIVASLKIPYLVVSCGGYELGKIKWVYENTKLDRFIFLQDSVVVRNNDLLMSLFDTDGSHCIMCDPSHLGAYMGLYERRTLDLLELPTCHNKADSIINETKWTSEYISKCEKFSHPIDLPQTLVHGVTKHGRENLL